VSGTLQSHQITIEQSIYKKRRREKKKKKTKKKNGEEGWGLRVA